MAPDRPSTRARGAATDEPGTTDGRRRSALSLWAAFVEFTRWPSPRIIAGLLVGSLAVRLAMGGATTTDLWLALGMVAAHPMVEWSAHVFVLHMKPVEVAGRTLDPLFARKHREHHAEPRRLDLTFLPTSVVVQLAVLAVAAATFAFPRRELGFTFLTTIAAIGLVYEWTHYLVHTDYRPKRWLYRALWRHHRLHHYKNERYWFAFTATWPDRALQTAPSAAEVETSPTVRDLLGTGG